MKPTIYLKSILLFTALLLYKRGNGQLDSSNWILQVQFGIEKHDKRLFEYPEKDALLKLTPEAWGTYSLGAVVSHKIGLSKLNLFVGSGIIISRATFVRPFDHFHFHQDSFYIVRHQNQYSKVVIPFNTTTYIPIGKNFSVSTNLGSYFLVYRNIDNTNITSAHFPYTEGTFELHNIALKGGINYSTKNFMVGLNIRLLNYQKIDKIIFNSIIKDPRTNQTWEFYNPLSLEFSVSALL